MRWLSARFLSSFMLSVFTGFALTANAYVGGSHEARFGMLLSFLILMHAALRRRLCITRELVLYLIMIGYMIITLAWTPDLIMGLGIVLQSCDFALVTVLVGALCAYHDLTAVMKGLLLGFLLGAIGYFLTTRFPLVYPEDFSYNTVAGMYLFGLFITLTYAWYLRSRILPVGLSFVLMLHIAATTSIKTNLGVALGVASVVVVYMRDSMRLLLRNFILLAVFAGAVTYAVVSNEGLSERFENGFSRVSEGAQVLAAREDDSGSIGIESREYWKDQGLKGWSRNPILGYGVEAFRADYGITSHSTPIDLVYNSGIIGLVLFYGMFASVALRVWRMPGRAARGFQTLTVAALACYGFMSLSATLYYDPYVAAFLAITSGVLGRFSDATRATMAAAQAADGLVTP